MGDLRPAVFLDRDGTIIEDRNYLGDPEGVALLPGAADAIARLKGAGLPVFVVTNQSGIGRGYFSEQEYELVSARLEELLTSRGARLEGIYHCPHAPGGDPPCDCRKPRPGLFERAAREHGIDLAHSFYIGDRPRDVLPGVEAGGAGILVGPDNGSGTEPLPDGVHRVRSLQEAVTWVLRSARFD